MTRKLVVEPGAEQDLRAAFDWYDSRRHGLGREFLAAVGRRLAQLQDSLEIDAAAYRDVRRAAVPHFPHFVFYLAQQGAINVVAIMEHRSASRLRAALR